MLRRAKRNIRVRQGTGMGGPLTLADSARMAEKAGISSIGMPDHFAIPEP